MAMEGIVRQCIWSAHGPKPLIRGRDIHNALAKCCRETPLRGSDLACCLSNLTRRGGGDSCRWLNMTLPFISCFQNPESASPCAMNALPRVPSFVLQPDRGRADLHPAKRGGGVGAAAWCCAPLHQIFWCCFASRHCIGIAQINPVVHRHLALTYCELWGSL